MKLVLEINGKCFLETNIDESEVPKHLVKYCKGISFKNYVELKEKYIQLMVRQFKHKHQKVIENVPYKIFLIIDVN